MSNLMASRKFSSPLVSGGGRLVKALAGTNEGYRALSTVASSSFRIGCIGSEVVLKTMIKGQVKNSLTASTKRCYNFASTQYASCFLDLPKPDVNALRKSATTYLDTFDKQSWYEDPVCSILRGEKLLAPPSNLWVTKDALNRSNGHQYHATPAQVKDLSAHIQQYQSPYTDIRTQLRNIEQKFLNEHAGFLIGNQCLDFQKQDGITEMEESIMANAVERCLNDQLLEDELAGKVKISRKPSYVSCVSNFTNFLDLFRKTIRQLELGIPCVVLGRSHTIQHSYRWAELLTDLLEKEGVDPGMLTYLSCTLDDIKHITKSSRDSAGFLYTTCSRELAADIKSSFPNTVASTGGPNTLFTTEWTPEVQDAIRMSAAIESSGQCTALRHCVVPEGVTSGDVEKLFDEVKGAASAEEALREQKFDGVFECHAGTSSPAVEEGKYKKHSSKDAFYKVSNTLPGDGIEEYWRKVVVDVTTAAPTSDEDAEEKVKKVARWLNTNQPISLATNAPRSKAFGLARSLFEKTGLVVYTVGSTDNDNAPPALTCQARPQEAEIFGEFPPRKLLDVYTKYPVVVPSSTPAYDSAYTSEHLNRLSVSDLSDEVGSYVQTLLGDINSTDTRGFCIELVNYLANATSENPKNGHGTARTALWGIQRPPLLDGILTTIRCGAKTTFDDMVPVFLPFYVTNARSQMEVSVHPDNTELLGLLRKHDLGDHVFSVVVEEDSSFQHRVSEDAAGYYNIVEVGSPQEEYPMVGQFLSLYFPLGHIKSTMSNDSEFVEYFKKSEKWLKMASA